jgi:alpha-amylase/alpha-mannosidase (GH57 family)
VSASRFVAIHGHFYQPPRENPWLERIEVQDSAAPYHDWNARVAAECYAPNTAARLVDGRNRIVDIVNNFAHLSFDVGPTLLSWLARERPDVYAAILEADRTSRATRGHGNALAQAYGHAILPLCSRRDKVTHVRWGLADFRHRFGRDAEGMWLPEAAVDGETLRVLAEAGVRFTILAPEQAAAVREAGGGWRTAGAALDPRRAYRYDAGDGHGLALFFYDAPLSRAIAFEGLLGSGEAVAERLLGRLDARPGAQLVHVATDGETYGHHHRFGDMALAAACARLAASGVARLTNHAAFLAAHPPTASVRIVEPSSWSCVHGVERWRADCGCRAGRHPGGNQRWRGPLRETLDWLRDVLDPLYEARAGAYLKDPWAARDDYVTVVLDRSPQSVEAFLARHRLRPLDGEERVLALRCLELQRHRLLMYTSCGWFFDELSGLETVQVLRHAARAVDLARALDADAGLETELLRRLAAAPSNVAELGDGAGVWRRLVTPAAADAARVAASHAIALPWDRPGDAAGAPAFGVERTTWARERQGDAALAVGRLRVTSRVTGETADVDVGVLHAGIRDVHCVVRPAADPGALAATRDALFGELRTQGTADLAEALDRRLGGRAFGLRDLFPEERRRLLGRMAEDALGRLEEAYRQLVEDSRPLLDELRAAGVPAPPALQEAARHALRVAVHGELAAVAGGAPFPVHARRLRALLAEAAALGAAPDLPVEAAGRSLEAALGRALDAREAGVVPDAAADVPAVLALAADLGTRLDLWDAQNRAFRLWRAASDRERGALGPILDALGFAVA